ncbi:hypothetical protein [Aureivirga sp. CE67]|uniref:hypothetical protein n=1 Tax=Aureivirga sp. CE67 TaxID=1788983 RepID=UPI0018CAA7A3|nr:hypothetical protein [Aureivirga sp. CE67]
MKSKLLKLTFLSILTLSLMSFMIQQDWYQFQSEKFGYKVLFPTEPIKDSKIIETDIGQLETDYTMLTDSNLEADNLVYMVVKTKYPKKELNSNDKKIVMNFFEKAINAAINKSNGELLSEKVITYGDYPGREIKIASQNGITNTKMRIYLIENTSYIVETTYKKEKEFNASSMKFMDSFELLEE